MARIRSTHPEQWTDEDFVELSFAARLLTLAIRNECDDKGIFEWKPKRIKMRIFPCDNVDVSALLIEMVECNQCTQFMIDNKHYGAVRNFRKYQKPKTPNDVHPINDEIAEYVGLLKTTSPKPPGKKPSFPPKGEKLQQMEETKVKKKEIYKEKDFLDFWKECPNPVGQQQSHDLYKSIVNDETALPAELLDGMRRYAEACRSESREQKFIKQPKKWLAEKMWLDGAEQKNTFSFDEQQAQLKKMREAKAKEKLELAEGN